MSRKPEFRSKFRPNPARQALLIGLALAGVGIGYGLGFLFKETDTAAPPAVSTAPEQPKPAAKAEAATRAEPEPIPRALHEPAASIPSAAAAPAPQDPDKLPPPNLPAVVPDIGPPAPGTVVRAYEEALPRDVAAVTWAEPDPPAPPAEPVREPEVASLPPEPTAPGGVAKEPIPQAAQPLPNWRRHAVAVDIDDRPRIAIVIDDMGVDRVRSRRTVALNGPLTLSYLAYAKDLDEQSRAARAAGHELLLHVPMEPSSPDVDPGPHVLVSTAPGDEVRRNLIWNLGRLKDYVGINNHMGSRFTSNREAMDLVMKELKSRGLLFLDSVTSGKTVGQASAHAAGVPFVARNVFLDHVDAAPEIRDRLAEVERVARRQGYAIAIGHPREATLKALKPWLNEITGKGFQLVPVSAIVAARHQQGRTP